MQGGGTVLVQERGAGTSDTRRGLEKEGDRLGHILEVDPIGLANRLNSRDGEQGGE